MNAWRRLWWRLWPRPADEDGAIREEIRLHVEMRFEEYRRAGLSRTEARRRALERFGDTGRVWLECREAGGVADPRVAAIPQRGEPMMHGLARDLRYALRMMRKNRGFSLVVVATLALGLGANTAIFSVVRGVLLQPLPWPEPDRLVRILESNPVRGFPVFPTSPPNFMDWKAQSQSFEYLSNYRDSSVTLTGTGEPERLRGARVSHDLFALLGARPLAGRFFVPEEDTPGAAPVAVIGEGLWRRRFGGDRALVGQVVQLDGEPVTIVGIAPAELGFPRRTTEIWTPSGFDTATLTQARGAHYIGAIGRLRSNVSLDQARAEMREIAARLAEQYPATNADWTVRMETVHEAMVGNIRSTLWTLFGAVFLVLLIACANVANLMLVHAAARSREIAIQAALGAGRWRVARQLFVESLALALTGAVAGLALAWWGIGALRAIGTDVGLPRAWEITLDPLVFAFAFGLALATGAVFGVLPVLQMFRSDLQQGLREGSRASAGRTRQGLRGALVVAEVSLSLVLLVGAGLFVRSLGNLRGVDLGLATEQRLTFQIMLPEARYRAAPAQVRFIDAALAELQRTPGVVRAAMTSAIPLAGDLMSFGVFRAGETPGRDLPSVDYTIVSPEYFATAGIPLLGGRTFGRQDDLEAQRAVVINRTMAERFFGGENPIGQRLQITRGTAVVREVIGVVGDVRRNGLVEAPGYQAYEVYTQAPDDVFSFLVQTAVEPESLAAAVRTSIRAVEPEVPVARVMSMDRVVDSNLSQPRFRTVLLGLFSAIAVLLAAVGLYGVMAYSVEGRTREFGVRMALGAEPRDILRLVLRHGLALALLGLALGVLGALWLSRFLSSQLFEIQPRDPLTFLVVAAFLALVALAACWTPARRATRVSPLAAMRQE